jgi:hypothetical protein
MLSRRRSTEYRRRGPEPAQHSLRLAAGVREKLLSPLGDDRLILRYLSAAAVPTAVAVVNLRKKLSIPAAVTALAASLTPLAVAAATPIGKWRYSAVGAAYMWAFKVTWELPYETREKRAVQVRYPIRIDSLLGGGVPPATCPA